MQHPTAYKSSKYPPKGKQWLQVARPNVNRIVNAVIKAQDEGSNSKGDDAHQQTATKRPERQQVHRQQVHRQVYRNPSQIITGGASRSTSSINPGSPSPLSPYSV
jgi:hypothetical protein